MIAHSVAFDNGTNNHTPSVRRYSTSVSGHVRDVTIPDLVTALLKLSISPSKYVRAARRIIGFCERHPYSLYSATILLR